MTLIPRNHFFDTDHFFSDFFSPRKQVANHSSDFFSPRIDIKEHDNHYQIYADLPGIKKENIHITLHNGTLTLEAEKKEESEEKKLGKLIRQERHYGKFVRSFSLSYDIQESDINANFDNGVLTLDIPKKSTVSNTERRIPIQ